MGKKNSEQNAMSTGESLFGGVDQERLEKAVDTSAGVSGGEMTVVSVKMSVEQRDTFKMYCLQKHIKLSDFYVAACREYMENHK